jgi:hypothetical protein
MNPYFALTCCCLGGGQWQLCLKTDAGAFVVVFFDYDPVDFVECTRTTLAQRRLAWALGEDELPLFLPLTFRFWWTRIGGSSCHLSQSHLWWKVGLCVCRIPSTDDFQPDGPFCHGGGPGSRQL